VHKRIWKKKQGVSAATKAAIQITREWQDKVTSQDQRYTAEFAVAGLGEKIDLVDSTTRVAYELKVSPNNPHMEFYRDMFKVLAHNEASTPEQRLSKLVFITPPEGAARLQRGFGRVACRIAQKFGFTVEVIPL
jgi:hypothetical protein